MNDGVQTTKRMPFIAGKYGRSCVPSTFSWIRALLSQKEIK
jgi:hypothetical protein